MGASVTLEGWEIQNPRLDENTGFLRVSKLTLNGKDYDLGDTRRDHRSNPPRPAAPYGR
ncbi:MAG: hypothetical protein LBI94_05125 [Treponema sp.]|nr:hypothetical protein [Treponema sp.]